MRLRRNEPFVWRAGYGWQWDGALDECAEFDTWTDAQHWLRTKITECTVLWYGDPRMATNHDFRWVSPLGQDFCLWRYYTPAEKINE